MARRDGTGPMGLGPLTGRGLGVCAGSRAVRYGAGLGMGLGLGLKMACRRGFGRGYGRNTMNIDQNTNLDQKDRLHEEKEILQKRLEAIDKALEKL
ncbi:conserved protein of unknown function [Petrocella atlantisensis]|uniref:DUF5320 domain-containing protein n=1 Tax=Petrocella atlantisensis TaxID=2173034 RepID=A0A3P7PXN3_9FIRM|nr:DUF5320 domain-containing protein [Petrocella atlantisensis]VDN48407.1 conserved protein of unknown function [Petrocella atlantisensis]